MASAALAAASCTRPGDSPVSADGEIQAQVLVPIRGGDVSYRDVYVAEGWSEATFVLDWDPAQAQRFRFDLRLSSGEHLAWDDPAVRSLTEGDHHVMATIDLAGLVQRAPAAVGPAAWLAEISSATLTPEAAATVRLTTYHRATDATPRLEAALSDAAVVRGQPVVVRALVVHRDQRGVPLTDAYVRVTFPEDAARPPLTVPLRDDGRPPDTRAGDGFHAVALDQTDAVGHHAVQVRVAATLAAHPFVATEDLDLEVAPAPGEAP